MPYAQNATEALVERLIDAGVMTEDAYERAVEIIKPVIAEASRRSPVERPPD